MTGPRMIPPCELCSELTVQPRSLNDSGWRPCDECGGRHAVCRICAEEAGLTDDYWSMKSWVRCTDRAHVARALMGDE